ncbi:MAG: hypothetical protein HKN14_15060 [Marinicaulis sp.]|nr:hypothetical protein [Marinicaulis sp.]NNL89123.1 hypothetical protein [Marinicaulis sp.]
MIKPFENFMLKHDLNGDTKFAVIQVALPQALYRHYERDADTFDTFLVLSNGARDLCFRRTRMLSSGSYR